MSKKKKKNGDKKKTVIASLGYRVPARKDLYDFTPARQMELMDAALEKLRTPAGHETELKEIRRHLITNLEFEGHKEGGVKKAHYALLQGEISTEALQAVAAVVLEPLVAELPQGVTMTPGDVVDTSTWTMGENGWECNFCLNVNISCDDGDQTFTWHDSYTLTCPDGTEIVVDFEALITVTITDPSYA